MKSVDLIHWVRKLEWSFSLQGNVEKVDPLRMVEDDVLKNLNCLGGHLSPKKFPR
jgi:hypothetical protein